MPGHLSSPQVALDRNKFPEIPGTATACVWKRSHPCPIRALPDVALPNTKREALMRIVLVFARMLRIRGGEEEEERSLRRAWQ